MEFWLKNPIASREERCFKCFKSGDNLIGARMRTLGPSPDPPITRGDISCNFPAHRYVFPRLFARRGGVCSVIPSLILASLTPEYIRIHHVSTITMGNFDLSPFIASSHSVSFGAAASIGQRSWSASSGYGGMAEGMGGVDLETVKYGGYYRDRIGLGGDEGVVWNGRGGCVEGEPGWDGGREGGLFLEECRAKNCFFGCGLSHPDTRYVGGGDMYGRDWGYH